MVAHENTARCSSTSASATSCDRHSPGEFRQLHASAVQISCATECQTAGNQRKMPNSGAPLTARVAVRDRVQVQVNIKVKVNVEVKVNFELRIGVGIGFKHGFSPSLGSRPGLG